MKNNFSTELATALTVIAITEGTTGQSHIELRQTRANTLRVMLYLEMYLDTPDHLLDEFFEDVKDETLDFTKVTGQTHPLRQSVLDSIVSLTRILRLVTTLGPGFSPGSAM